MNRAETHMRKGQWAEAAKVSGIEIATLMSVGEAVLGLALTDHLS